MRGQHGKRVDNPFLRCFQSSNPGHGFPTLFPHFPRGAEASAPWPRSVIRFAPPKAGVICTRRRRSRRACGRRPRRPPCAASPPSGADRRRPSSPCRGSKRQARLDAKPVEAPGGPPPIIRFPCIRPLSLATRASPARAAACSPAVWPSSGKCLA